jgi:hypothetical protein
LQSHPLLILGELVRQALCSTGDGVGVQSRCRQQDHPRDLIERPAQSSGEMYEARVDRRVDEGGVASEQALGERCAPHRSDDLRAVDLTGRAQHPRGTLVSR